MTRGGRAGRSRGRAGSHADVRGDGGGGERAVPLPAPAPGPVAPHSVAATAIGGTLFRASRWPTTRARCSEWRPCRLLPQPVPRPPSGAATCGPPVPPAALPDPAALSPTSSAASLAGRPGSKRADTGKFWGREGRALKGPRPLFTGGVGGTEEVPKLERNGKNVKLLRSFWLAPRSRSTSVPLSTLTRKKSPPVACGSRGNFPHLLRVFRHKCRYVCCTNE